MTLSWGDVRFQFISSAKKRFHYRSKLRGLLLPGSCVLIHADFAELLHKFANETRARAQK